MLYITNLLLCACFVMPAPGIKLCTIAGYRLFHSRAQVLILLTPRGEQEYSIQFYREMRYVLIAECGEVLLGL